MTITIPRYKLFLMLQDTQSDYKVWATAFGNVAEALLGLHATDMQSLDEQEQRALLESAVGDDTTFVAILNCKESNKSLTLTNIVSETQSPVWSHAQPGNSKTPQKHNLESSTTEVPCKKKLIADDENNSSSPIEKPAEEPTDEDVLLKDNDN